MEASTDRCGDLKRCFTQWYGSEGYRRGRDESYSLEISSVLFSCHLDPSQRTRKGVNNLEPCGRSFEVASNLGLLAAGTSYSSSIADVTSHTTETEQQTAQQVCSYTVDSYESRLEIIVNTKNWARVRLLQKSKIILVEKKKGPTGQDVRKLLLARTCHMTIRATRNVPRVCTCSRSGRHLKTLFFYHHAT